MRVFLTALAFLPPVVAVGDDEVELISAAPVPTASPLSLYTLDIEPIDPQVIPRLLIDRGPVDATIASRDGGWTLNWPTPESLPKRSTIVLLAIDPADLSKRQRLELSIASAGSPVVTAVASDAAASVVEASVSVPEPDAIASESVAAQEVSTQPPSYDTPLSISDVPPQTLVVGKPFSLWIRSTGMVSEEEVEIDVSDSPAGMSFIERSEGWYQLSWSPKADQTGPHEIELVVSNLNDRMREARRNLRLVVAIGGSPADEPVMEKAQVAPPKEPEKEITAVSPELNAIPSLIVNAGRTVQFRIGATLPPDQSSIVQIDRLPRNASFDENPDGSRTFHWPTADRDQGEHRFRFTAMNTIDSSLRDSEEITIIIGDPTRSKTQPTK